MKPKPFKSESILQRPTAESTGLELITFLSDCAHILSNPLDVPLKLLLLVNIQCILKFGCNFFPPSSLNIEQAFFSWPCILNNNGHPLTWLSDIPRVEIISYGHRNRKFGIFVVFLCNREIKIAKR